jgi:cytochrome c556
MRRATHCIVALIIMAACWPAFAHDHATGVVKERMDNMQAILKRHKAITDKLKDKRELDTIKADAEAITDLASHVTHLFPAGSTQKPTQARSAIWRNWADFEAKARGLETASEKLARTGAGDEPALGLAAGELTRSCVACHEKYRIRRR